MCTWVYACGRFTLGIFFNHFSPNFLKQGLSLNLELTYLASNLDSSSSNLPGSTLPGFGLQACTCAHHHTLIPKYKVHAGDPNTGPQPCESTLRNELSPRASLLYEMYMFIFKIYILFYVYIKDMCIYLYLIYLG